MAPSTSAGGAPPSPFANVPAMPHPSTSPSAFGHPMVSASGPHASPFGPPPSPFAPLDAAREPHPFALYVPLVIGFAILFAGVAVYLWAR